MALNDILTSMDGARDALVTAINAKGGSLADNATLYQCAAAVSNISTGTDTQEPVLLSPTNVTEETLALNTATNSYGTWNFSASNKASGYEPSALFMESYDNFTFGVESTHWLLVECTNTFAPESLYFYAGGSNVLGYTPKTLEIYGISNGVEYLLGTATLISTDQDANGLRNTVEATIRLDHGGRTYSSIKIIQTSNQTNTSVQAIWRKIEIRGYDHAVAAPCSAEYYKCASVDTSAKTWSGYKAVFDSTAGTWSFESGITEGLTYTSVTPVVGSTYNADATLTVMLHSLLFSDIIAYYKFDDNLNNYVSQYGTATSSNTTYVDGKSGKALLFNGSTSKCIVPKDISVRGRSRVSVSLWFNINSFGNKNTLYAEEIKNTYFLRFGLEILSTGNILGLLRNFDSNTTSKSIDGGSVSLQEWHFAVFTFDAHGQIAKLHVDGVLKGTVATSSDPIPDTAPARTISVGYFDGMSPSESGAIDGMIDELCIWSKALTDTEVSELYNNGAGKFL